ncbi:hypothetical protein D8L93_09080 [Sodalis-like symbiont of Bactericera trigonica]|nr:hypothetical protein D8L93_09080 [Sodalis-like symbiont of Bactericera trigonica]
MFSPYSLLYHELSGMGMILLTQVRQAWRWEWVMQWCWNGRDSEKNSGAEAWRQNSGLEVVGKTRHVTAGGDGDLD